MRPQPAHAATKDPDALFALLRALCDEIYALGYDIIGLGDALSNDEDAELSSEHLRHLQAFDAIGQRAIAQARLLQGLERHLAGYGGESVESLIASVPFHADRQRLIAALSGDRTVETREPQVAGENVDLF